MVLVVSATGRLHVQLQEESHLQDEPHWLVLHLQSETKYSFKQEERQREDERFRRSKLFLISNP